MKNHLFLLGSLLFLAVALAACGGKITTSMPGMNMGTSPVPPGQGVTSTPAAMTTVSVTETEFHITSSVTGFRPGTMYHFIVKNAGKTAHEFMILPKSEGSMEGMPMGTMDRMALASISEIGPGETKTLDYTFPPSVAGSHPEFACYLPGHYEAGMKLAVSVNAPENAP